MTDLIPQDAREPVDRLLDRLRDEGDQPDPLFDLDEREEAEA